MVEKRFASEQISRLIGLKFFPSERSAQAELVSMLSFARNTVIAVAVINEWLESQSDRPTPADIRRIVASHNEAQIEREQREAIPEQRFIECQSCKDEGIGESIWAGNLHSVASWCLCEAGQRRRRNSCSCLENPDGRCGRTVRDSCACPPWIVNIARMQLIRCENPTLKRVPKIAPMVTSVAPLQLVAAGADDYQGDF